MTTGRHRSAASGGNTRGRRTDFGSIRRLSSGRYQARFTGPGGLAYRAPSTFARRTEAAAWLSMQRAAIEERRWRPAAAVAADARFCDYAEQWLRDRDLKPRSRDHYRKLLDQHLLPRFGRFTLREITAGDVRAWYAETGARTPTTRAHCYGLLRAILATAVADGALDANPASIRGGGTVRRASITEPLTLDELSALVAAMPERLRAMTLLAAWTGLRFGELTELRRRDLDLKAGLIRVRRGVVRTSDGILVDTPKSTAGIRNVAIPPHVISAVREHLDTLPDGDDQLLFPAANDPDKHLAPSTLYRHFYKARDAAGRPDVRWHDLRHLGATLAAQAGASLAETMHRLGHSTVSAAMIYQHATADRDRALAAAMSGLVVSKKGVNQVPDLQKDTVVTSNSVIELDD